MQSYNPFLWLTSEKRGKGGRYILLSFHQDGSVGEGKGEREERKSEGY